MIELDALLQQAAENKDRRLMVFLIDVGLAAQAEHMGPGAVRALSQYNGWSAQTINRLAVLKDLPSDLIDPELPLGVYWCAHQKSATAEECFDWIRKAQAGQWSLAGLKEEMGLAEKRTPPIIPPTEADIVSMEPVYLSGVENAYRMTLEIEGIPPEVSGVVKVKVW